MPDARGGGRPHAVAAAVPLYPVETGGRENPRFDASAAHGHARACWSARRPTQGTRSRLMRTLLPRSTHARTRRERACTRLVDRRRGQAASAATCRGAGSYVQEPPCCVAAAPSLNPVLGAEPAAVLPNAVPPEPPAATVGGLLAVEAPNPPVPPAAPPPNPPAPPEGLAPNPPVPPEGLAPNPAVPVPDEPFEAVCAPPPKLKPPGFDVDDVGAVDPPKDDVPDVLAPNAEVAPCACCPWL